VSTRQQRIAELARQAPQKGFTSLNHHLDFTWMLVAYWGTRRDGATGVDGISAADYETDLTANLRSLLDRAKSGSYRAPPVRRVHISKGPGTNEKNGSGWILEVDIRKFFDTLDYAHLRELLRRRVRDGVVLRLLGKWLHAGVMEGGAVTYPSTGSPQGGVISPLLAHV
jgi:retron-type reverse transcriptase